MPGYAWVLTSRDKDIFAVMVYREKNYNNILFSVILIITDFRDGYFIFYLAYFVLKMKACQEK